MPSPSAVYQTTIHQQGEAGGVGWVADMEGGGFTHSPPTKESLNRPSGIGIMGPGGTPGGGKQPLCDVKLKRSREAPSAAIR